MGWNDSRVSLVAPGWRITTEGSSTVSQSNESAPIRVQDVERTENSGSVRLDPDRVQLWLMERGFALRQRSASFARLNKENMEVFLVIEDGELAEVILTFTLSERSPSQWETWRAFVTQICGAWGLGLYDSYLGTTVEADQLLRLLADTPAWREFGQHFGWPPVTSSPS